MKFNSKLVDLMIQRQTHDRKIICLSIGIFLYCNDVINKEKYLAICKSFNNGTIDRNINTYKSSINNKWYDSTNMYYVYKDIWCEYGVIGLHNSINIEKVIDAVMLVTNKTKNFSIDWIFYSIIKPIIDKYGERSSLNHYSLNSELIVCLDSFGIVFNYTNLLSYVDYHGERRPKEYYYDDCDCSRCQNSAYESEYYYEVIKPNIINLHNDFSIALNKYKHESYLKNPQLISSNYILL